MEILDCENTQNLLTDVIEHFGFDRQIDKAIEEMGELIQALMKDRYTDSDLYTDNVYEELADCLITLTELSIIYPNHAKLEKIIAEKLKRLRSLISPQALLKTSIQSSDLELLRDIFKRGMEFDIAASSVIDSEINEIVADHLKNAD